MTAASPALGNRRAGPDSRAAAQLSPVSAVLLAVGAALEPMMLLISFDDRRTIVLGMSVA